MANLTIQQYIAKLKRQRSQLSTTKAVFVAASTAHADQVERIFTHGGATDGGKIGNYNTSEPVYINSLNSPRNVSPKGKTGQKTFNNGKAHKTAYFDSYKAFRQAVGRETAFVNLDLFGRLKSEYENSLTRIDNTSFEATLRTEESTGKAIGNQRRFAKAIFGASQNERDTFRETLRFEINRILNA